jgi:hypothetical protein
MPRRRTTRIKTDGEKLRQIAGIVIVAIAMILGVWFGVELPFIPSL